MSSYTIPSLKGGDVWHLAENDASSLYFNDLLNFARHRHKKNPQQNSINSHTVQNWNMHFGELLVGVGSICFFKSKMHTYTHKLQKSTMFRWSIVQSRRQDSSDEQNCKVMRLAALVHSLKIWVSKWLEYRKNKSDQKLKAVKTP